jgi:hypothetical protein
MSREYAERAVGEFMATDWRAKAAQILDDRIIGVDYEQGPGEIFVM